MSFSQAIQLVAKLKRSQQTCACAESCTGGLISASITAIPGSSDVFNGAVVAYSNAAKLSLLDVKPATLDKLGAVCAEVAEQMALGARRKFGTDFALATTGLAGPEGGTLSKPVGLVFIAWAADEGVVSERFTFTGNRNQIQMAASQAALEGLLKRMDTGFRSEE